MKNLKGHHTDMAADLFQIFSQRAERFKDRMYPEQEENVKRHIRELKQFVLPSSLPNKIYLVSEIERILLIVLGISEFETQQLIDILVPYIDTFDIHPDYITTLYIFQKEKLVFQKDLYTNEFNMIVRYFNERNLIYPYDIKEYDKYHDLYRRWRSQSLTLGSSVMKEPNSFLSYTLIFTSLKCLRLAFFGMH